MRLLHLDEHDELSLTTFADDVPPYAILSHTWGGVQDEVSFQDLQTGSWKSKAARNKIEFCLKQAQKDGISHFWIDTCCIDKQDKHGEELRRAITSMYRWYADATKCYVFLSDVSSHKRGIDDADVPRRPDLRNARYWTRGWTLQELLAPKHVEFYSRDGDYIGDRSTLRQEIHSITGISLQALEGKLLSSYTVEERLRWSERRQTTEKEDRAYCLSGILGVSILPNYGEGDHAYERLMNEVKAAVQTSLSRIPAPWATARSAPMDAIPAAEHRQVMLESLRFEQMDSRRITIRKADPSTCDWFMSHTAYVDWLQVRQQAEPGFLWLIGKAGAGKSTLMKHALPDAENAGTADETVISFFFNARGDPLEKSTEGMYRALLWQLFDQMTDIQDLMDNLHSQAWTLSSLQSLFRRAASRLQQRRVRCFIDALDECPEQDIRDMISFLEDLITESNARLSICFASRPYPTIDIRYGQRLILEEQEGHDADIVKYVQKHLRAGKGKAAENIKEIIRNKANHVFLWVVLVVRILNDEFRTGRIYRVKQRLNELPPELGSLFKEILLRDNANKADLLLALQWILYTARPLSREEFYYGMVAGLAPETVSIGRWDRDEVTPEHMTRFVLDSSKGLAELTKSKNPTVQFIHESVRDYLIKEDGMRQLWPDLGPDLQEQAHSELSRCCRSYLYIDLGNDEKLIDQLPKAKSPSARELRDRLASDYPFLRYAVEFIWRHLERCPATLAAGIAVRINFARWIMLSNAYQQHDTRRQKQSISLPYFLVSGGFTRLLSSLPSKHLYPPSLTQGVTRRNNPILAAAADGNRDAVMMFLAPVAPVNQGSFCKEDVVPFDVASSVLGGHDQSGCTIVHWTARWNWADIAQMLMRLYPPPLDTENDQSETPLHHAAMYGSAEVFRILLDHGASVSARDEHGRTVVHRACEAGHANILDLLYTLDVDWDSRDRRGYTPLMRASKAGHYEVVQTLLSHGVAGHTRNDSPGNTALLVAVENGHDKVVQILLDSGAESSDVANSEGMGTLLGVASSLGRYNVARLLLAHGADVNMKGDRGHTPLHYACQIGQGNFVQLLLDLGADVNSKDAHGYTALHVAWDDTCLRLLLDHGADIHAKNHDGATALHFDCLEPYPERWEDKARLLLQRGANIEALDKRGKTPLMFCCYYYHAGFLWSTESCQAYCKILLEQGANTAAVDQAGRTALHYACNQRTILLAQLLISHGAPTVVVDKDGKTPRDLAGEDKWSQILEGLPQGQT